MPTKECVICKECKLPIFIIKHGFIFNNEREKQIYERDGLGAWNDYGSNWERVSTQTNPCLCIETNPDIHKPKCPICLILIINPNRKTKYCGEVCSKKAIKHKSKEYNKKYISRPEIKQKKREWSIRYNRLPKNKVATSVRNTIYHAIKKRGMCKTHPTFLVLGYAPLDLVKWLESQFTEKNGYSWNNYGDWHIDHIRPIASFDFDSMEHPDFKKCWALNNLQPLWATDNMRKNDKWDGVVNA